MSPSTVTQLSSSAPRDPAGEKGRRDFPTVRNVEKKTRRDLLNSQLDDDERTRILEAFDADVTAASSSASVQSTWRTWLGYHRKWFGPDVPPIPLTPAIIRAVGACFKEGAYVSFSAYMSKAKEMHILDGYDWSHLLDICSKKATRSVTRGAGTARQSNPFDLEKAITACTLTPEVIPACAPVGWVNLLIVGTYFVMREIELAFAQAAHVTIKARERKAVLLLPVSKKDPKAVGCERTWACLCDKPAGGRPDCPFCALKNQLALLGKEFGSPLPPGLPLFPSASGLHVDKAAVVSALECIVAAYGDRIVAANGCRLFGGHSFRVTGAQRLASLGVEVVKIMVLARWSGETVLRYIRDAPLANLSTEVLALENKRTLLKTLGALKDGSETLSGKIEGLEQQLKALLEACAERDCAAERARPSPLAEPFVTNGAPTAKAFKVHEVLIDGSSGALPTLWRTKCGFRFAFGSFTRHASVDNFASASLCRNCGLAPAAGSRGQPPGPPSSCSSDSSSCTSESS